MAGTSPAMTEGPGIQRFRLKPPIPIPIQRANCAVLDPYPADDSTPTAISYMFHPVFAATRS